MKSVYKSSCWRFVCSSVCSHARGGAPCISQPTKRRGKRPRRTIDWVNGEVTQRRLAIQLRVLLRKGQGSWTQTTNDGRWGAWLKPKGYIQKHRHKNTNTRIHTLTLIHRQRPRYPDVTTSTQHTCTRSETDRFMQYVYIRTHTHRISHTHR